MPAQASCSAFCLFLAFTISAQPRSKPPTHTAHRSSAELHQRGLRHFWIWSLLKDAHLLGVVMPIETLAVPKSGEQLWGAAPGN